MNNHHWIENKEEGVYVDPDNSFGFLYTIVNLIDHRLYVGKKQYWTKRRVKKAGRKNRVIKVSSNKWEYYTGSSRYLNEDIERLGKDNFLFIILENVKTKGGLHYGEIQLQLELEVLTKLKEDGSHLFYNRNIAGTKFLPKEFLSEETKKKIGDSHRGMKYKPGDKNFGIGRKIPKDIVEKNRQAQLLYNSNPHNREKSSIAKGADQIHYTFNHRDGESFVGTKYQFSQRYNISAVRSKELVDGFRIVGGKRLNVNTVKGWTFERKEKKDA